MHRFNITMHYEIILNFGPDDLPSGLGRTI